MEDDLLAAQGLIDAAMADVKLIVCPSCRGLGKHPEGLDVRCPRCDGRGEIVEVAEERCVFCGEEGQFEDGLRCKKCQEEQDARD